MPDTSVPQDSPAILGADLTPRLKVVYMAIRTLQDGTGWCRERQSAVAEVIGKSRSVASRAINKLARAGWIEREDGHMRCLNEPVPPEKEAEDEAQQQRAEEEESRAGFAQKCAVLAQKRAVVAQKCAASAHPDSPPPSPSPFPPPSSPNDYISNPLPSSPLTSPSTAPPKVVEAAFAPPPLALGVRLSGKWSEGFDRDAFVSTPSDPTELRYTEDDWQHQFAQAAWHHLENAGVLSATIERKASRDPAKLMDDWANTFRLLHEQDGYDLEEIKETMRWALSPGSWWMKNRALASAASLRRKTRDGSRTKFDAMHSQALTSKTNHAGNRRPLNRGETEDLYHELLSAVS
jgi:hypothetical protein